MSLTKKIAIVLFLSILIFFVSSEENGVVYDVNEMNIEMELSKLAESYDTLMKRPQGDALVYMNTFAVRLQDFIERLFDRNKVQYIYYIKEIKNIYVKNENPMVTKVIENYLAGQINRELGKRNFDYREPPVYLPGYGYTDNNYVYKFGRELSVEEVAHYWKTVKRRIESSTIHEFYIKSELTSGYSQGASAGGNIEGFKVTGETMFEINGKLESYSRCEIVLKEVTETNTMILFKKNKVWVELWGAESGFFSWLWNLGNFEWELIGETYKFHEEPAGTEIIIDPSEIANL